MSIGKDLQEKIDLWLEYDKNPKTLKEIEDLVAAKNVKELEQLLSKQIKFGTAGLRADMRAGFSKMNDLTVLQASQGLAKYYAKTSGSETLTVVIGHDHRYNSQSFAEMTAKAFLLNGFKVYYLNKTIGTFVHTPLVPFAINKYGADVGVMITASHNPGKDNGYKVYHTNGCQIIPPVDSQIAKTISENLKPMDSIWDDVHDSSFFEKNGIDEKEKFVDVFEEITNSYISKLMNVLVKTEFKDSFCNDEEPATKKSRNTPLFVYTPMHGVGKHIFDKIMKEIGLVDTVDYITAEKQAYPDPAFPTAPFPNPEEHGALDVAIGLAKDEGIDLIVSTDPDADRFSMAFKQKDGTFRQLTGDEIGYLFAYYMHQTDQSDKTKAGMVTSTVSSGLLKRLCDIEKRPFQEVLTGFKWIGNAAAKKAVDEDDDTHIIFGYEEAIGYMFPSLLFDKDGISAAVVLLQLYKFFNQDLESVLKEMFTKYGYFKQNNGYFVGTPEEQASSFKIMRGWLNTEYVEKKQQDKTKICKFGDHFVIKSFRDLTKAVQFTDEGESIDCDLPTGGGDMITFWFKTEDNKNELRATIRGSGTEPKLKIYIECMSLVDNETAEQLAKKLWVTIKELYIQPETTGLHLRS